VISEHQISKKFLGGGHTPRPPTYTWCAYAHFPPGQCLPYHFILACSGPELYIQRAYSHVAPD